MIEVPTLIQDLAYILISAAIVSLLFKRLKLPVVLGYILAGLLVGPQFHFFPTVADTHGIQIWAEIGVLFLLFSLGLEFSFRKLAQVGWSALFTAIFEISTMLLLGYAVGKVLGWDSLNSIFLAGIVSISSTSIILRTVSELGLKGKKFIDLVFGILIVEDLVAILLLVMLTTVSLSQNFSGSELLWPLLRLFFFLGLWFALGIFFIPLFLKRIRVFLNDESTLVVSIGLCLLMVLISTKAGFSAALGAFVMGSLLAETSEGKNVERVIAPVRDLFSAIFFVSIGMLFDPSILRDHMGVVLILSVLVLFGKTFAVSTGALLSGQNVKSSIQSGLSLSQMGEFSFILASLGLSLGVTPKSLYGIAVAVSLVTCFTTPLLIKNSEAISHFLERFISKRALKKIEKYRYTLSFRGRLTATELILKAYGIRWFLNTILIIAVVLSLKFAGIKVLDSLLTEKEWLPYALTALGMLISSPFFAGLLFVTPRRVAAFSKTEREHLVALRPIIFLVKFILATPLIFFLMGQLLLGVAIPLEWEMGLIVFGLFNFCFAEGLYSRFENQFSEHLSESKQKYQTLVPWDAHLSSYVVSPHSEIVAKSLMAASLKENYGVTVAVIERGHKSILAPGRDEIIFPGDRLYIIGLEEQLALAQKCIEVAAPEIVEEKNYGLETLLLSEDSKFVNKAIRNCGLREAIQGLIIGIERSGERILNPDSMLELAPQDLLWVVGDRTLIKKVKLES